MQVDLVSDEKQFWELEKPWKELQSLGAVKDITTTWEWMSTWWEVFKDGRELAILVAKDGDKVVGIAPFIRRKIRYFHLIPYRRIEFIASGEDKKDKIYSEYLDFIIEDGREEEVLESVFQQLCRSGNIIWDELVLPRMKVESPVVPILYGLAEKFNLDIMESNRATFLYADLPDSFDGYLGQLGRSTRHKIRQGTRRLDKLGDVVFKVAETEEEVEVAKDMLIRLHQSRWSQKGKPGVFSSERFRQFHDKMISIAHRENWLKLVSLLLNGKPVACVYNLLFRDKIYSYQAGMEVSEISNVRYGRQAHVRAIADAISEGAKEYDFLSGVFDYKERLAKGQREIITLRISKPTLKEPVYRTMCRLKVRSKALRDRFLRSR